MSERATGRGVRIAGSIVGLMLLVPFAALAGAWLATPGAGDLPRRVAQRAPRSSLVTLDAVAPIAVKALVATEDERFWSNSGIDVIGIMRALPYDATHLSLAQGGSTLTEQLTKNLWLGGADQSIWAKLKDMALALKVDRRYSKDAILSAYLNTAYFGHGAYGIGRASRRYFGVAPGALSALQATVLVGLVQAPTAYDPYVHPTASRVRQISVLRSLVRVGALRVARARRMLSEPLRLADGRVVPGIRGVDLSTGPALAWMGIAIAVAVALVGVGARIVRHLTRERHPVISHAASLASLCLLGASLIVAVRSLRVI
jgi:penicillin-binding protein 1A